MRLKDTVCGRMGGAVKAEVIPSHVSSASDALGVLLVVMDSGSLGPSSASSGIPDSCCCNSGTLHLQSEADLLQNDKESCLCALGGAGAALSSLTSFLGLLPSPHFLFWCHKEEIGSAE